MQAGMCYANIQEGENVLKNSRVSKRRCTMAYNSAIGKDTPQNTIFYFTINGIDFLVTRKNEDQWKLQAKDTGGTPQTFTGKNREVLEFLVKTPTDNTANAYSCYHRDVICNALYAKKKHDDDPQWHANLDNLDSVVERIRKAVLRACGKNKAQLPFDSFLKRKDNCLYWFPQIKNDYIPADFRKEAVKKTEARNRAEKETPDLIDEILEVYPELDPFFHKIEGTELRLHFAVMEPERFGRPSFPLRVEQCETPAPNRGDWSLLRTRQAEKLEKNAKLFIYPGLIYRLLSACPDAPWTLGRTKYTELIESCDYLNFTIKSGWQLAREQGGDAARKFLEKDAAVKEWRGLVAKILKGDFSTYLAGIAFSIPIFQVCKDGSLKLLMAQGSSAKQADYGMHVAPAGMLEFSPGDSLLPELSLRAFQTIVAKEMAEETLVGKDREKVDDKYKRLFLVMESGDTEAEGDPFREKIVRLLFEEDILPHWDHIWKNKDKTPSKTLLEKALCLNPAKQPMFWVIDSFTLRPEIIMPLYIEDELPDALNWEYEEATRENREFKTWKAVLNYVSEKRSAWTAPGLAALYFGSRHFFFAKNKDRLIQS